jgi:ferritin-like metal-binding protein YciE
MASEKNLRELFHDTLKDIYFAEKKILSALPKMAKAAASEELKAAFEKHKTETKNTLPGLKGFSRSWRPLRAARRVTPSWASSRKVRK